MSVFDQDVIDPAQVQPTTAIARVEPTPMMLIQSAIDHGIDIDKLERLFELQQRWEADQGKKAFAEAIAAFQNEMPPIEKKRKADRFTYAGFDDIMAVARPILSKHGITIGFDTQQQENGQIKVTARLRVGSYHEDRSFAVPVNNQIRVSNTQQFGATLSYAKRYCLCAALNIVTVGEDKEGDLREFVNKEQIAELSDLLKRTGSDIPKFLQWAEADSISEMTVATFHEAVPMLKRKLNK